MSSFHKFLYAGATPETDYAERIAIGSANLTLALTFMVSLPWAMAGEMMLNTPVATFGNSIIALLALLLHVLMYSASTVVIRVLTSLLTVGAFALTTALPGPGVGAEFYAAPILGLTMVMFTDVRLRAIMLSTAVVCMTAALIITHDREPLANMDEQMITLGYNMTLVTVTALTILLMYSYRLQTQQLVGQLSSERGQFQNLLSNVLPDVIVERINSGSTRIADSHGGATVLFADLQGFSELSTRVAPTQLVDILDQLFQKIDDAADQFGVEKIKTIGDCYMAACGILEDTYETSNIINVCPRHPSHRKQLSR